MFKILKYIYGFWVAITFVIITFPMLICYLFMFFVPYKYQIVGVYYINRFFMYPWSTLLGYFYKIKGRENIVKNQTYIVVSNHINTIDLASISAGLRVYAKPLVKKELTVIPGVGQLFSLMCLTVDRSNKASRQASKVKMLSDLKQGISIFIFPEGTRNRGKKPLLPFFDGAFELAIEAQVPVLPAVQLNTRKLNPDNTWMFRPGIIELVHLPPVPTKGLTLENLHEFKEKVHQIMADFILKNDEDYKD
jgi:1-acyl-sn-glycerol-3-phosphate acyltransferase